MKFSLYLVAFSVMATLVVAQIQDDASSINPEVCGLMSKKAAALLEREKRYTSGKVVSNQADWGWQVVLVDKNGDMRSGSLINSQWVLSFAYNIK
jgi:hypothetical protein